MQKLGFGLIIVGIVGVIGLFIWGIAETSTELTEVPLFVWLIIGAIVLGVLLLLITAIRDRIKQSKTEDFKEVDK
jgi:hypothetical protein